MDVRINKNDIIVCIVAILVSGIALWFCGHKTPGQEVSVTTSKGEERYSLNENRTIELEDTGRNVIVINNGAAYMQEADCRDQICVKHKPISKNGETIICLPNDVFVTVKGGKDAEIDN